MSNFANVYVGTAPNDLTGDPLRNAFQKINTNFANIEAGNANITVNAPVRSVAGRTGNVVLAVNDVYGAASLASVIAQTNAANVYANVLYATTTSTITANVYSQVEANLASQIATIASDLVTSGDLLAPLYNDVDLINANVTAANARIATLNNSVNSIGVQINSLIAADNTIKANLGTATNNISALQAGATAANNAIDLNTSRITAANVRIASLDANVGALSATVSALQVTVTNQGSAINTLTANASSQANSLAQLTANAATQDSQIKVLEANLGTATTNISNLSSNAASQGVQINSLIANASAQSTHLRTLDANLGTATTNISTLSSNAAIQATHLRTLDANLGTATTNIATNFTNINYLRANINAANTAIVTANTSVVAYVNDLNVAQTANAAAQGGAIQAIYANLGTTAGDVNTLFANAAAQSTQITNLFANAAAQAVSIQNITVGIITINSNTAAANIEIGKLRANITAANAALDSYTATNNSNLTIINSQINDLRANITAANTVMAPVANVNSIIGNLSPQIDNNYQLGTANNRWKELYTSGNIQSSSYILAATGMQTPLTETGNLNANTALIYAEAIVGNIRTVDQYGVANLGNVITTSGVFWANGNAYITSGTSIGNVVFSDTTISTADGTTYGIILNSAGAGEIAMQDFVGINNLNPGYWLHIGDGSVGATNNTGNVSVDFNNGTDAAKASTIIDYAWWDASSNGNDNRGTGPHTHFGIYKNDETHDTAYIEFDVNNGSAKLGDWSISASTIENITNDHAYINAYAGNGVSLNSDVGGWSQLMWADLRANWDPINGSDTFSWTFVDGDGFHVQNRRSAGAVTTMKFTPAGNLELPATGTLSVGNIAYTMGNSANWNTAPTTVAAALDELAARLKAAGF